VKRERRIRLLISGRVQGVCFRAYTRDEARSLGLKGWVRNLPDGRVEAVAQGDPAKIETFESWCRHGPSHARVRDVKVIEEATDTTELDSFEITY
jgi:acylphosphatase